jgi:hypothetical protein
VTSSSSAPVTVIVTTYNHERFIEQALTSVVEQETNFPFEVVVIEDCSTDGTRELVQGFAARHPEKVRPMLAPSNENKRRLFSEAWASASTEYVATLDGDDYWSSPHKLQQQVDIMATRPEYSFCFHDVTVVSDGMEYVWEGRFTEGFGDGTRVRTIGWLDRLPDRTDEPAVPGRKRTFDPKALWTGCFVPACSPLLRRTWVPELPEGFADIRFGDWALYLLLAEHGPIVYLDEVLGVYRVHPGGMWSGLPYDQKEQGVLEFFEQLLGVLPERELEIGREIDRRRRLSRLRSVRWASLIQGQTNGEASSRIDSLFDEHVPSGSTVIWIEPALQPVQLSRSMLSFPESPARLWEHFGTGEKGRREASWIAPGYAYEFRLLGRGESHPTRATTTVVAERYDIPSAPDAGDDRAGSKPDNGLYLAAAPNPARMSGTHASTEVAWSTGDDSPGEVVVAPFPLEEGMPSQDDEAIAGVERLKQEGAEFLLLPRACFGWLELYPGLGRHLDGYTLLADSAVGRLYDLRG